MNNQISFTRVNNNVDGNPRYVCHYTTLLTETERDTHNQNEYAIAVKRANKIGGRRFHNKQYGGGIVFQSYNLENTKKNIIELVSKLGN